MDHSSVCTRVSVCICYAIVEIRKNDVIRERNPYKLLSPSLKCELLRKERYYSWAHLSAALKLIVSASARGPASICHGDATYRYVAATSAP